jgi:hypothetical protein
MKKNIEISNIFYIMKAQQSEIISHAYLLLRQSCDTCTTPPTQLLPSSRSLSMTEKENL